MLGGFAIVLFINQRLLEMEHTGQRTRTESWQQHQRSVDAVYQQQLANAEQKRQVENSGPTKYGIQMAQEPE